MRRRRRLGRDGATCTPRNYDYNGDGRRRGKGRIQWTKTRDCQKGGGENENKKVFLYRGSLHEEEEASERSYIASFSGRAWTGAPLSLSHYFLARSLSFSFLSMQSPPLFFAVSQLTKQGSGSSVASFGQGQGGDISWGKGRGRVFSAASLRSVVLRERRRRKESGYLDGLQKRDQERERRPAWRNRTKVCQSILSLSFSLSFLPEEISPSSSSLRAKKVTNHQGTEERTREKFSRRSPSRELFSRVCTMSWRPRPGPPSADKVARRASLFALHTIFAE